MTVYAVALITIEDRVTYKRYQRNFGAVFEKFQGKVLAMRDKPRVVEGEWVGDKVVIMAFPSEKAFEEWRLSPEYLEIVGDRFSSTAGPVLLVDGHPWS
ncbi:MAG: DUF1330 domain-containing protein [Sphingobium sp.]|jgi:uncharacterized protein (DUF1330 family)